MVSPPGRAASAVTHGRAARIAPGVWRIDLPIPDSEVPSVAVYALVGDDGRLALIDAGYDDAQARAALESGLADIGRRPEDVHAVLLTHSHPDHHGLSAEIPARSGGWAALHEADAEALHSGGEEHERWLGRWRDWCVEAGVPAEDHARFLELSDRILELFRLPRPSRLISRGWREEVVGGHELSVIELPGHSNGQVGFLDRRRRLLYGGDALLRGALTSVPSNPLTKRDPLRDHLRSLERLERLEDVDRLAPGHGPLIDDIPAQVSRAREMLRRRVERVAAVLESGPATAWEVAERLPRGKPLREYSLLAQRAMLGETIALLHLLEGDGRAACEAGPPKRWRKASAA